MPTYTLDIPVKTNTRVFCFNSVFLLTKSVMLMTVRDSQTFVLTTSGVVVVVLPRWDDA